MESVDLRLERCQIGLEVGVSVAANADAKILLSINSEVEEGLLSCFRMTRLDLVSD